MEFSGIFNIDNIIEPEFNEDIMDTLVMEKDKKEIIRAICYEFTRTDGSDEKTNYHADSIRAKGAGRIFLLHGEPGVGKTLTAECVAEATRRPLLSIT
jgi:MoxR-like ATPase